MTDSLAATSLISLAATSLSLQSLHPSLHRSLPRGITSARFPRGTHLIHLGTIYQPVLLACAAASLCVLHLGMIYRPTYCLHALLRLSVSFTSARSINQYCLHALLLRLSVCLSA